MDRGLRGSSNQSSAKFMTKHDFLKGYWQVPLTPRTSEIAAFVTPDSFLQYSVMAFSSLVLHSAPATFQRLMNMLLANVPRCVVYLDNVVVYTN